MEGIVGGHVLLGDQFLNFLLDFVHDLGQVVLKLDLQFLVVTSALVWGPFLQDFGESKKDLAPPPLPFGEELVVVVLHESIVDVVLPGAPASCEEFLLSLFRVNVFGFGRVRLVGGGS